MTITDDMKTDWYHCSVNPAYVGTYETRFSERDVPDLLYWNGNWWQYDENRCDSNGMSLFGQDWTGTHEQWRGLKAPHDGETS